LTIEYALSRVEVIQGYFCSWKYSPTFRWQMVSAALGVGLLTIGQRWLVTGAVRAGDILAGLFWAVGLLVFIPLWFALRLKRQKRTLKSSDRGIEVIVGDRTLRVPWSNLSAVVDADEFVIISRRNINSFYIPRRAFGDSEERERFVESAKASLTQYRHERAR
jgi:YcxB-like protein